MIPSPSRTEHPVLHRRRNPHIWSWLLKLLEQCSLPSLAVKLLGLLVEWSALLDDCEALDLQFLTGLIACHNPRRLLAPLAQLLADDLAMRVLHEVSLGEPSLGLCNLAKESMTFGELGGDGLLLHGFHGFHGSHGLHGFHCLHCFGHC